jgi:hypothetical protein
MVSQLCPVLRADVALSRMPSGILPAASNDGPPDQTREFAVEFS